MAGEDRLAPGLPEVAAPVSWDRQQLGVHGETIWARVWKASAALDLAPASRIIWPLLAPAEQLGVERDDQAGVDAEGGAEILGRDFGTAGHADLVEHQPRRRVVGTARLDQVDHVLGVAQRGQVRGGHHHDFVGAEISVLRIQPDHRCGRSSTTKGAVERMLAGHLLEGVRC
jgi:hypothetical protein